MPLKALNSLGEVVYAKFLDSRVAKQSRFICPYCNGEMIYVDAVKKIKHFRHRVKCPFIKERESEEHEFMKEVLFEYLRSLGYDVDLEVKVWNHVADLVIKDLRIIIECQRSNIDVKVIKERMRVYTDLGYHTFWLFYKDRIGWKRFRRSDSKRYFYILSTGERFIIHLNKGKLYYLDPENETLGKYVLRKVGRRRSKYAVILSKWFKLGEVRRFIRYKVDGYGIAIPDLWIMGEIIRKGMVYEV